MYCHILIRIRSSESRNCLFDINTILTRHIEIGIVIMIYWTGRTMTKSTEHFPRNLLLFNIIRDGMFQVSMLSLEIEPISIILLY